ncbi:uncharacterized protein F4812DRAFT_459528 [Daldinia caldariorum]|uniref:uncharacterized protein n=1 Tax=Daldinia caldariorum TaxID=326644 RepID=UPI002008A4BE|nr:uncharacterized protein F4812DRAFT_459528 [Daldinia caldariorum]KAI1467421.1 hypothetical protein F4812DRAFT_459528 [Daldinia caldariorum]
MEKASPSSPVPSNTNNDPSSATADDVLQSQFQQLIQHNATAPSVEVHNQISSKPPSRYSSPVPPVQQPPPPQQQMVMPIHDHPPTYNSGYQQQNYQMEPSPYPQLPDTGSSLTPHNAYSTPATSPPTPLQTDSMRTRSGRSINRTREGTPMMSSRGLKRQSPMAGEGLSAGAKKKKKTRGQADEPAVVLDAPLSVLVKDITTVQDTNIEEYVNRGVDVRQREVRESKDGKVKRPMNAFMLYRKSYQNRAKEWRKHDNHQVISRICGVSWAMEPRPLKEQFDTYSKIERANHGLAFPDYKFAPAKAKNRKTGSRSTPAVESEDEGSDLEGYHWDTAPPSRSSSRPIYDADGEYRPPGMRAAYPTYASPVMHHTRLPHPTHPSSFHHSNPGKPRPVEYGVGLGPNQYYQQTSDYMRPTYPHHIPQYGSQMAPFVENVYMNKANSPAGSYHSSPVDHYGNMIGSAYPPPPHPYQRINEHPIDPSLMGQQGSDHFDPLSILGLGGQGEGLQHHYQLDQGGIGGHHASDEQQHHHQQFEQAFHHPSHTVPEERPSWHDDTPNLAEGEWETLAAGTDFDIDGILGTTDSPGG